MICSLLGNKRAHKSGSLVETVLHCGSCDCEMLDRCTAKALGKQDLHNLGFLRTTKSGQAMTEQETTRPYWMDHNAVMVIIGFSTDCVGRIQSWHVKDGALEEVELGILTCKSKHMDF